MERNAETIPGTRAVAARMVQAEESFLGTLMAAGGIDRAAAELVFTRYRTLRVLKSDAVGGRYTVTDGAFLDREVVRRAAGL